MNNTPRILKIILIAILAIMVTGISAFADRGKGFGHFPGMHRWDPDGPGCEAFGNLSEEEVQQLDAERQAFFEATRDLKREIYQKRLALMSELSKKNPVAETAVALQQEISDLKARMARKRLEHILAVRNINPDLGRGFWAGGWRGPDPGYYNCPLDGPGGGHHMGPGMLGYHMGPGMMGYHRGCGMPGMFHQGMMGPAGQGRDGYYNCPLGGPGGGYHMGSGPGRGSGMMGLGWSERDCPRQYNREQGSRVE